MYELFRFLPRAEEEEDSDADSEAGRASEGFWVGIGVEAVVSGVGTALSLGTSVVWFSFASAALGCKSRPVHVAALAPLLLVSGTRAGVGIDDGAEAGCTATVTVFFIFAVVLRLRAATGAVKRHI